MKKLLRLAMCCLVAVNVLAVPAFARVPSPENYTSVEQESGLCDKSVSYDIDIARPVARRGNFFKMCIRDSAREDCTSLSAYVQEVPLSQVEYMGGCSYCSQ